MVRKLTNQELTDYYGLGLPAEPWFGGEWSSIRNKPRFEGIREGARFAYPPLQEGYDPKHISSYDWFNKEYAKEFPVWQPGAFTGISPPSRNAGFSMPTSPKSVQAISPQQPEQIPPSRPSKDLQPLQPRPSSNEILPQSRFSNLPDLGPRDPGAYKDLNINNYVRYGEAVDRRGPGGHFSERIMPPYSQGFQRGALSGDYGRMQGQLPPEASIPLPPEVSGEQAAAVPIDQVNRDSDPTRFAPPTDLVGGSFFSGPDQTGGPAIPGSGYLYSHPVLKSESGMPVSEMRALARKGAPASAYFGPAMTLAVGSQIPGAGLLGLLGAGLNKLGAYHQFNPAADSNLFADPVTGRATWGTTDPGGVGSQRGTLNLYNMLQDIGSSAPRRQVQTPSKTIYHEDGSTSVVPQYANARDLAYMMRRGERAPGLYTQQTPLGYQDFGEDHNVTKQEALNTYNRTGAGAILNEAAEILGPDAGYNETSDLAEAMADDLQGQMDYGDWGSWY